MGIEQESNMIIVVELGIVHDLHVTTGHGLWDFNFDYFYSKGMNDIYGGQNPGMKEWRPTNETEGIVINGLGVSFLHYFPASFPTSMSPALRKSDPKSAQKVESVKKISVK